MVRRSIGAEIGARETTYSCDHCKEQPGHILTHMAARTSPCRSFHIPCPFVQKMHVPWTICRRDTKPTSPHRVALKIYVYVELVMLHLCKTGTRHSRETSSSFSGRWCPPRPCSVLVNVDAAIFSNLHKVGVGILIRNHNGDCSVACTEPLNGIVSPELAESWALRSAVSLARDEGFASVVFASDCLSLIQRINSSTNDRSEVGAVVTDIKLLAAGFSSVSFCHVKRSSNVAAHFFIFYSRMY